MILLLIIGIPLLAGIALWIIGANIMDWRAESIELSGVVLTTIFGILMFISVIALCLAYGSADATVAQYEARYESLKYQMDHDFYETENEVGKAQLIDQVREWNEELASNKKLQRNIWIGAFIPNIYDEFEFIPLETPEKGGKG